MTDNENSNPNEDPLALSKLRPEWSANVPLTPFQKAFIIVLCLALLGLAIWRPWNVARIFVLVSTVFYLLFTAYKLLLVRFSVAGSAEIEITAAELAALNDDELPVYSIMVPMYKEAESVAHLVESLARLDYPADKKDVQLLLEEDDVETRAAAEAIEMPPGFALP